MSGNNVITDIESKNKATSHLFLSDLIFIIAAIGLSFLLRGYVNPIAQIPYMLFNFGCAIFLILPSKHNKGRNNLESVFVMLRKDSAIYRQYISGEAVHNGSD